MIKSIILLFLALVVIICCPPVVGKLFAQDVSFIARRDFAMVGGPSAFAQGDFNGDNIQDLALTNQGANNGSILMNDTRP